LCKKCRTFKQFAFSKLKSLCFDARIGTGTNDIFPASVHCELNTLNPLYFHKYDDN
jgi:hypothetical protein